MPSSPTAAIIMPRTTSPTSSPSPLHHHHRYNNDPQGCVGLAATLQKWQPARVHRVLAVSGLNPPARITVFHPNGTEALITNIKHSSVDKPSQDLNHVNFFDEIVHEGPDTSYDDNDINAHDQSDGSNSSNPGSPTIDLCGKLEGG
ncbi:hypothetical protein Tco_1465686 [Tanacetum coccineum]